MNQNNLGYDIIVIGSGLTGSALSYELAKENFRVLLLEKDEILNNATTCSYGGVAYWCGTDDLTNQLCEEAINIHRQLSLELDGDTEFREIDLLFTIDLNDNPENIIKNYQSFYLQPQLLDRTNTVELEPLLNGDAINGALRFPQGHVNPSKLILAYQNAYLKLGGKIEYERVISIDKKEDKITGITTNKNSYFSDKVIISAGGFSRQILTDLNLKLPIYFSHAQLIKTIPSDLKLRTIVMPSMTQRLDIEKALTSSEMESIWDTPHDTLYGDVLETGAIQFLDGSLCLGQISQIIPNLHVKIDRAVSEQRIRNSIAKILPSLSNLEGKWYNCQVAFSQGMPFQVKEIPYIEGLSVFTGFTSPFVFVPPLAKRFANYLAGKQNFIY